MSEITLQEIPVLADGGRHEGRLVLMDGQLVAVFTWVTPEETVGGPDRAGGWFLEAGFGPCGGLLSTTPPVLATLDDALAWVRTQLVTGLSRS